MLYLLDANVLIDANRDYYPMVRVPEFWAWLIHQASNDMAKIPSEILEEAKSGGDELARWLKRGQPGGLLLLDEDVDAGLVAQVVSAGYAPDLNDEELIKLGRDPFLIAYALASPYDRIVVTTEVSRPSAARANRRIPDVCDTLGVEHRNSFQFIRELDFRTNWSE